MKNVMEAVIVNRNDMLPLTMCENEKAHVVGRSIADWLANMRRRSKPQRFLCLDCDVTSDDRRLPEAFAVTLPFTQEGGQDVTTAGAALKRQRCAAAKVRGEPASLLPGFDDH
jgi:hypothetical protein